MVLTHTSASKFAAKKTGNGDDAFGAASAVIAKAVEVSGE